MPGVTCGCGQVVKVTQVAKNQLKIELTPRNRKGCAEARRLREEGKPVPDDFDCPRLAAAVQFAFTMRKAQVP